MDYLYFDYAATTPLREEVARTMFEKVRKIYGNPSSPHRMGQQARVLIDEARESIAGAIGCMASEIVFTGSGTEANNWVLKGMADTADCSNPHFIVSAVEHPSVLECARYLARKGCDITYVRPGVDGRIDPHEIMENVRKNTELISLMFVNNETGVIQPVFEIADFCQKRAIKFHCDAVQALGKLKLDLRELKANFVTLSAHKIFGPKGVGALFIRNGNRLEPMFHGGHQEADRRAGTENLSGIIGFSAAVQMIGESLMAKERMIQLRDYFEQGVKTMYPDAVVVGEKVERSPYISQIAFPGLKAENLQIRLDMAGVAVSVGSACSSGAARPSHVLKAMGLEDSLIEGAIRFSFSTTTTREEIDRLLEILSTQLSVP